MPKTRVFVLALLLLLLLACSQPQRIKVGGNVQSAKLVRQPRPVYPPLAKQARISGVVKLSAVISKDGTIKELQVISGHPLLVPAALEAVKQWVYQPTLLNGEPVEVPVAGFWLVPVCATTASGSANANATASV